MKLIFPFLLFLMYLLCPFLIYAESLVAYSAFEGNSNDTSGNNFHATEQGHFSLCGI